MNKREKLLDIIQALTQKTVGNGCTEAEALAAAEKAQEIMKKHGLSLADIEAVDPGECEQSEVEIGTRMHPVYNVAGAIADFTDTEKWYCRYDFGYHIVFFGLPADVQIASYLLKIIRNAMDLEWRFFWAVNSGLTPVRSNAARKNFMNGMGNRIATRLSSMKRERESRDNDCKAIVLRKKTIVEEVLKAAGIEFSTGRLPSDGDFDENSYAAGDVAGMRISLNAGELK